MQTQGEQHDGCAPEFKTIGPKRDQGTRYSARQHGGRQDQANLGTTEAMAAKPCRHEGYTDARPQIDEAIE